jgi:hypothetical protein
MDMCKLDDLKEWVRDWAVHYSRTPEKFYARVAMVAREQRINMENATSGGRHPTWCDPKEYRRCVERLEDIARRRPPLKTLW